MNYENYELLFCVENVEDPAIGIVKNLMKIQPHVDAHLLIHDGLKVGINLKINNMNPGYLKSKYDLIMLSDDKMVIQPDALQEMVNKITSDSKIGCVYQMATISSRKQEKFALFDKLFLATFSLSTFFSALTKYPFVVNGMSALYKKKVFEKAGGMAFFGKFLLEDINMHWYCHQNGWKVELSKFKGFFNQEETGLCFQYARFRRWFAIMDLKALFYAMIMTLF